MPNVGTMYPLLSYVADVKTRARTCLEMRTRVESDLETLITNSKEFKTCAHPKAQNNNINIELLHYRHPNQRSRDSLVLTKDQRSFPNYNILLIPHSGDNTPFVLTTLNTFYELRENRTSRARGGKECTKKVREMNVGTFWTKFDIYTRKPIKDFAQKPSFDYPNHYLKVAQKLDCTVMWQYVRAGERCVRLVTNFELVWLRHALTNLVSELRLGSIEENFGKVRSAWITMKKKGSSHNREGIRISSSKFSWKVLILITLQPRQVGPMIRTNLGLCGLGAWSQVGVGSLKIDGKVSN
ncbi:hypothetical protein Scep_010279 [Stephania cephalantha]|uniref:Uncharacterized protein n=1 Tax=Stephania cephalantha TaxID=152367 RepID=A0AAP0JW18_9MAGN